MDKVYSYLIDSMLIVEILCGITAVLYFYKYKTTPVKWVLWSIWFAVLIELISMQLRRYHISNHWLYNILGVSDILIYQYIFHEVSSNKGTRRIIRVFILISFLLLVVEGLIYSDPPFQVFLNYSFSISSFLISISALLYLRQLVRTDKILHLKYVLLFWISIGLLFYHVCNLPITVLSNILSELELNINALLLIQTFAAILMYSCFILGFVWSKKKYNF